jgi:Zn-dependent metalloprotease
MALLLAVGGAASAGEEDGLAASQAFQSLKSKHPSVQAYRTDGNITRLYGQPFSTGSSPEQSAAAFVQQHSMALGAPAEQLVPQSLLPDGRHTQPLMFDQETGRYKFTLVYYSQVKDGLPVYESEVRLLVRNEPGYPLVLAVSTLRDVGGYSPDKSAISTPSPTALQAVQNDEPSLTDFSDQKPVVYAGDANEYAEPKLGVELVASSSFPEKFRYVVDPVSGEILYKEDLIIFEDVVGNSSGVGTPGPKAMQCTPSTQQVFPYARADISGGDFAYADENGDFVIPNAGTDDVTVTAMMRGEYFTVYNYSGSEAQLSEVVTPPGPVSFVFNEADASEQIRAQVNGYLNANEVRDFILTYNPSYPTISTQTGFPVYVNRTDGYCPGNAWYDGSSINFCQSGSSFGNTSFASVSQHEYGHHLVNTGGSGQGAYGEGMSDCVSMLIADDPGLGYGFYYDQCNTPLRNADNTFQYPCDGEIHYCGQLLSGCVWSTRNELEAISQVPGDYIDILAALTINSVMLHTGTEITPQITIDFLTLDDDDANLDNGTPHWDQICAGFGAHNMACPDLAPVWFSYPDGRPETVEPYAETTLTVVANPGAVEPLTGSGKLFYAIDDGQFEEGQMVEITDNVYEVTLPAAQCDQMINWYVEAESDGMGMVYDPAGAPLVTHEAVVATEVLQPFADDFESILGWTVSGSVSDGAWERGIPIGGGDRGDPPADFDGSGYCYLTDNVDDNSDVDGGTTILHSPTIDLSAYDDAKIHYARWYSNNFGADPFNDEFKVYISADDGGSWTLVETVGPVDQADGGWYENTFWVSDFVTPSATMKMRFDASDLNDGSVVEAAIDDFTVTAYECIGYMCGDVDGNQTGPNIEDLVYLVTFMFNEGSEPPALGACDVNGDGTGPNIEDLIHLVSYMFNEGPDLNCP